ncbi:MAG: hypothetical protein DRI61_07045 [Chloroflexi bacterium]|nr:MAG: hypothetical protein DRI61_07045 [Chloroflexota bacterium]
MEILSLFLKWLSQYWPQAIGMGLVALIIRLISLHLEHRRTLLKLREQESRCNRLLSEGKHAMWRAKNSPYMEEREEQAWIAIKKFSEALPYQQGKKEKADTFIGIGEAYEMLGMLPDAESQYKEAVKLHPSHRKARLKLVDMQLGLFEDKEALENIKYLFHIYPDDEEINWLYKRIASKVEGGEANRYAEEKMEL